VLAHLNDAPKQPIAAISDGDRLLPGEGAIDPRAFLNALRTAGYDGPVSLEVFSAQLKTMPPLDAARKAWTACKNLLANSGA
jgi:4-hydroxyphenylpyruvate dioxygenase